MFSSAYKRYALSILTLILTLNFTDRAVVAVLLQPIKEELRLSDTQLGLLTGIAFGLMYAALGLPVARWADRGNRVTIASVAIALWGLTAMSCLFVSNFIQLVTVRIFAGVGEAGCMPPTYSLVGDYFPGAAERIRAVTIYWLGNPLAALIGAPVGGWLSGRYGWRFAFFAIGIPGLLLAILTKATLCEPRRSANATPGQGPLPLQSMSRVLGGIWHQSSSRHLCAAIIIILTVGMGLSPWYGAFLIRSHGIGTAQLGAWFGLIFGAGGMAGTWLGGYAASRWLADDPQTQMRVSAVMFASVLPCVALFVLLPKRRDALVALALENVAFLFCFGPAFALLQRLVAENIRATALAVVMLLANIFGLGIAPLLVGAISDWLTPTLGTDSLRYAILAMSSMALWAALHLLIVARTARDDLAAMAEQAISQTP